MTRPPWEVADIIRRAGNKFLERYRDSLTWTQLKVLRAIERCRTAALGGHRDRCVGCGHQTISGVGMQRLAEHYEADFAEILATSNIMIKDC